MRRYHLGLSTALLFATLLGAGCASGAASGALDVAERASPRHGTAGAVDLAVPDLEESALLLLLVDRQLHEPFSIGQVLRSGRSDLRRLLALTLARVPDARALPALEELAIDGDPEVRLAVAFAAGRIGGAEATTLLEALLTDADARVGAWACHGLARAGVSLDRVIARLAALDREARQARLLPDLHRFARGDVSLAYQALALEGLDAIDPWLRTRALHALVVQARPAQRTVFARLLADGEPGVRALAAAGLGAVGGADDLEPLRAAAADASGLVAVAAIRAAGAIIGGGRAAPPEPWRETLVERIADPRPAVRAEALTAAGIWLAHGGLGLEVDAAQDVEAAVIAAAQSGAAAERGRAVLALAGSGAPAAIDAAAAAASDSEPWVRARAARAAAWLRAGALLERLAADADPIVREAAFLARLEAEPRPRDELYLGALADAALGSRAAALERLAGEPVVPYEAVLAAFAVDERDEPELALLGVDALRARAQATPTERGSIVAALEGLAEVGGYPVRLRAAAALESLGRPRPPVGPATIARSPGDYRSIVARTRQPRWLRLETSGGAATLRLDCADAPLSCLAFVQLAEQGFYDGTVVYRVVPWARIEGGDQDGDGRGSPGFTLRDEPSPRRLRAGAFGLVQPAPHGAGARFFVLLAEAPEPEGGVTVLGEVAAGLDLLGGLLEVDRIVRLRETSAPVAGSGRAGGARP